MKDQQRKHIVVEGRGGDNVRWWCEK